MKLPLWAPARRQAQGLSLRTRLTAVLVGLLFVSCAILTVVISVALHASLVDRLDQQLAAAGSRYALSLEHPNDHDADNEFSGVVGQATGTIGARIVGGQVTESGIVGGQSDTQTVSAADRAVLGRLAVGGARDVRLPVLGEYRVIVSRGHDGDLLVTGLPLKGVDDTTARLTIVEAVVFVVALVLTAIAGAICVGLTLRPLDRVARTARSVTDLPLGRGDVQLPTRLENPAPATEVGQVTDAVNSMLEHVNVALLERHRTETLLRQFVADASHELRTPVAVIRSHAEYAQMAGQPLNPDVALALTRIGAESERMGTLIEELLLLARLDSGRPLPRSDVDLTAIVFDAVIDARAVAPDHDWQLDLPDTEVVVSGDANALRQVLSNLLANAAEHTPTDSRISVTLNRTGADATLLVSDDGPGIDPEFLPHVFERFARSDSARSHTGGEGGLGLAIVQAIVRAHGGSALVSSRAGETTFTIRMPLARTHGQADQPHLPDSR